MLIVEFRNLLIYLFKAFQGGNSTFIKNNNKIQTIFVFLFAFCQINFAIANSRFTTAS
jgi:hypothetical protein